MTVTPLTDDELACLKRLEREPDMQQACSQLLLESLVRKGLIIEQPLLVLPVLPQRWGYHLTSAGRKALAAAKGS